MVILGQGIQAAGDVNKDGYDDLFVMRPNFNGRSLYSGRVDLYYGSATGLQLSGDFAVTGLVIGDRYGTAVVAGDVNKDGLSDIFCWCSWC